jgi:FixJ family two-component response regulator
MTTGKQALFEDWYREQWLKQNKIDAVHNPMARPAPPRSRKGEDTGTRSKIKLSKQAEVVNRMLLQDMLGRQIGELLGISQQAVSEIKKRYGLPRKPEETKDE